ncbi:MAG TPA: hypothetical protein PLD47_15270, partial [Aggregatilineales bacterium]|nr:hypothetical protein [Aggregatilineales bacterium]
IERRERWYWRVVGIFVGLCLAACDPTPPPTPVEIIYITATPERPPETLTPSPVPSPVLAAVELITRTPLFPTATKTPQPAVPPTETQTFTPTYTESPLPPGTTLVFSGGVPVFPVPGGVGVPIGGSGTCLGGGQGGFAAIAARDTTMGCAVGAAVGVNTAVQDFEGGRMVWVSAVGDIPAGAIYVLYNTGGYQRFADTWIEGVDSVDAPGGGGAPPGRSAPIRGFGKVWGVNSSVRAALGWALGGEQGGTAQVQRFAAGEMVYVAVWGRW